MFKLIVLLGCVSMCLSTPVVRPLPPTKPTNYTNLGVSPFGTSLCEVKQTAEQIKSGVIGENYRWRNGFTVHPDRAFTANEFNVINEALYELSTHLCIQVLMWPQDSSPTGDYVEMMRGGSGSGCWSYVGKLGGRQELNLQFDGCIYKDIVMHESIHALGYNHEQCRPDRDDHVNIFLNNIPEGNRHNFDKMTNTDTFGTGYDIRSIMHYGSYDFSNNGQPTILAKDGSTVGSQGALTGNDVDKLKRMYGC